MTHITTAADERLCPMALHPTLEYVRTPYSAGVQSSERTASRKKKKKIKERQGSVEWWMVVVWYGWWRPWWWWSCSYRASAATIRAFWHGAGPLSIIRQGTGQRRKERERE